MPQYPKTNPTLILPGTLRHRIRFLERKVKVFTGKTMETWEPTFTCHAGIEPLSHREYFQAAAVNRENEIRFVVRYRSGIRPDMNIEFRGQTYIITNINNPGMRNVKLEILAKCINESGV